MDFKIVPMLYLQFRSYMGFVKARTIYRFLVVRLFSHLATILLTFMLFYILPARACHHVMVVAISHTEIRVKHVTF